MARVLILYYSLTHQTEKIVRAVAEGLEQHGHAVFLERLELEEPYPLPAPPRVLLGLLRAALTGAWPEKSLRRPGVDLSQPFDLVILGYQPWFMTPSVPMHSFLKSELAEVLRGRPVVGVMTCRALYERASGLFESWVEARGGSMVEQVVWQDEDKHPTNFISLLHTLKHGHDRYTGPVARIARRFGVGEAGAARAKEYGVHLAARLESGPLVRDGKVRVV